MSHRRLTTLAVAAALAAAVAGTAVAQGPGRMMERGWGMWDDDARQGWGMWRSWRGPWGRGPDWMLERIEGRLAFIKAELKITEAQAPAWNDLAQAIRNAAKQRNERMKALVAERDKAKTLPERLETQEQFMTMRLDELKQIKASLKSLYGVLGDEQKKEADEMIIPMAGMGHGWGM